MTESPQVTVAIPTYNRADMLRTAIDSVLDQTLQDFELIVLDNASTDDTPEVVASFKDSRLTYHRRAENIGHRANLNAAFHAGSAPIIAVLQDKDRMLPRNLEAKLAIFDARQDVVMVHGGFRIVDDEGNNVVPHRRGGPPPEDTIDSSRVFLRKSFNGYGGVQQFGSVVLRRSALGDDGLREQDAPADDVALWLRMGGRGSVGYVAEHLTVLRAAVGWSTANDFLEISNGRFYPTFYAARGGRKVRSEYLARNRDTFHPIDRALLSYECRSWTRRQLIALVRRKAPNLRPWSEAKPLIREALTIEPTLLLTPRIALLLRSYDSVERVMDRAARSLEKSAR